MLALPETWASRLVSQPETGMGYQIATVLLKDGRRFERVTIAGGTITAIEGAASIPFSAGEISDIIVTHGR